MCNNLDYHDLISTIVAKKCDLLHESQVFGLGTRLLMLYIFSYSPHVINIFIRAYILSQNLLSFRSLNVFSFVSISSDFNELSI